MLGHVIISPVAVVLLLWSHFAICEMAENSAKEFWKKQYNLEHVEGTEQKINRRSTESACNLPDCFLPRSGIPGHLQKSETPMLVYFSFDDAINPYTKGFFDRLFTASRKNPNGCPIAATHFNSHNYTLYSLVEDLYQKGHEFASHSINHRPPPQWWRDASKAEYREEICGQRENLNKYAGIPEEEIRGMRVPFLQLGNAQFDMLHENEFTYDASMSADDDVPSWPFTLHDPESLDGRLCQIKPCPTKAYPLWEVPLNTLYMDSIWTPKCAMVDGCRPNNKEEALTFLQKNFRRHYDAETKPAFGLNMHASWFAWQYNFEAMCDFVDDLLSMEDVWIVPAYKVIQWMQNPTPNKDMLQFQPFLCQHNDI